MTALTRKTYTLEEDLTPVIKGVVALPNIEDVDPIEFLNRLACFGHSWTAKSGYSNIDGKKQWTYFFLFHTQAGTLTGEGYAVRYGTSYPKTDPRVMSFAICRHEIQGTGTSEQARRGWHPGHCKLCGLDMTVDSGD